MLQKFLGAIISEEWASGHERIFSPSTPLIASSALAKEVSQKTLTWLQGIPPPAYHEMAYSLGRIHAECIALLQLFHTECKLPMSSIPFLGNEIDITDTRQGCFTIETAQQTVNSYFNRLRDSLGRTKKKEQALIAEKRGHVVNSIERYLDIKGQYDIRVSAAFAAAFVGFRDMPDKVSPVVKGIMNGIKVNQFAYSGTGLSLTILWTERGKRGYSAKVGCSSCFFHRILLAAQYQTASGQDCQKPVHLPLPRYRKYSYLCLQSEAHGWYLVVPRISSSWSEG
jgi:hypothetical protein